jgi:Predicted metal-binding integral membrane protein (DUF2182)
MMNLVWMGVLAVLILLEKGVPFGRRVSQVIGVGLVAIGVVLIAAPHPLPTLVCLTLTLGASGSNQRVLVLQ